MSKPKLGSMTMSEDFREYGNVGNAQHAANGGDDRKEVDIVYLWHVHIGGHLETPTYGNRQKGTTCVRRATQMNG